MAKRRTRGEGSLFRRCDAQYGCPPSESTTDPGGKTQRVRPPHRCRGMWIGQLDRGRTPDGKRYRPTVSARTRTAAAEKLTALALELDKTGGTVVPKNLTVADWLTYWLHEIARKRVDPGTWQKYRTAVEKWLIPGVGHIRLHRLSQADLRKLYDHIATSGSPGARPGVHACIRKALSDAEQEIKVGRNVAKLMDAPAGAGGKRGSLTAAEARAIMKATVDDRLGSRWEFAFFTGARPGECTGLEWTQLDLDDGVADISWQLQRLVYDHGCGERAGKAWPCEKVRGGNCPERTLTLPAGYESRQLHGGLHLVRPKADTSHLVPLVPSLVESLRGRRTVYRDERRRYQQDHGLVWCELDGRPLTDQRDRATWHAACDAGGVPPTDLYATRHTTATLLMELGADPKIIQQILGHANALTTERYKHVSVELARAELARLEAALQSS